LHGSIDKYIALIETALKYTEERLVEVQPKFKTEVMELDMDQIYKDCVLPDKDKLVQIPIKPE